MSASAEAADDDGAEPTEDDEPEYAEQGSYELGGTLSVTFSDDTFAIEGGPTFGFFIVDRVELSATLTADYERNKDEATGNWTSTRNGSLVLEPSYHHPIAENILLLGGLGFGPGLSDGEFELDVIPRIGVNFVTSRSNIITPSIKVPIYIGKEYGDDGNVGSSLEVVFQIGLTTTW